MEDCFVEKRIALTRTEVDRYLHEYEMLSGIIRSSRTFARSYGEHSKSDEAALTAKMYRIRTVILSVEDTKERMFLYHYYIKGLNMEKCAHLLGISVRSTYRLKKSALESVAVKIDND